MMSKARTCSPDAHAAVINFKVVIAAVGRVSFRSSMISVLVAEETLAEIVAVELLAIRVRVGDASLTYISDTTTTSHPK